MADVMNGVALDDSWHKVLSAEFDADYMQKLANAFSRRGAIFFTR